MAEGNADISTPSSRYRAVLEDGLRERQRLLHEALEEFRTRTAMLAEVAARLVETLRASRKVLVAGNGGSAAEAQHFAAELVGRFKRERDPYPVMALCADTAIMTAVANDYGYQEVFARQVGALGHPGDLLLLFSTSGESENLARAAEVARRRQVVIVAVTGDRANRLEGLADLALRVPATDTAIVQELHTIVTHLLCELVEVELIAGGAR